MIVHPFYFGSVDGDLDVEMAALERWLNVEYLQPSTANADRPAAVMPIVQHCSVDATSPTNSFSNGFHLSNLLNMIDVAFPLISIVIGDTYGQPFGRLGMSSNAAVSTKALSSKDVTTLLEDPSLAESTFSKADRNFLTAAAFGHANWVLKSELSQVSLLHILLQYIVHVKASATLALVPPGEDATTAVLKPTIFIRRPLLERTMSLMSENGQYAYQRAQTYKADAARMDRLKRQLATVSTDVVRIQLFSTPEDLVEMASKRLQDLLVEHALGVEARLRRIVIDTPSGQALADQLTNAVTFSSSGSGKIVTLVSNEDAEVGLFLSKWLSSNFAILNPNLPIVLFRAVPDPLPKTNATCVILLLEHCISQLRRHYHEFDSTVDESGRLLNGVMQPIELEQDFAAALAFGPCLVVLMGIDRLTGNETGAQKLPTTGSSSVRPLGASASTDVPVGNENMRIKQLAWLPKELPPSCCIIVTTTPTDMTLDTLKTRGNVEILDASSLQSDGTYRRELFKFHSGQRGIEPSVIPRTVLQVVLTSRPAGGPFDVHRFRASPLHLCALARHVGFASNPDHLRRLEFHVESKLELPTQRDLLSLLVRRWASAAGGEHGGQWVINFLRCIALSCRGIPISHLGKLLKSIGMPEGDQDMAFWTFWFSASFLFASNHEEVSQNSTIVVKTPAIRRCLNGILFSGGRGNNSMSTWRRRYIRFLKTLPKPRNQLEETLHTNELITQVYLADDLQSILTILSNGDNFLQLSASTDSVTQLYLFSLLHRLESSPLYSSNSHSEPDSARSERSASTIEGSSGSSNRLPGLFHVLVARFFNKLGLFQEHQRPQQDFSPRDENISDTGSVASSSNATLMAASSSDELLVVLPTGQLSNCSLAWRLVDWLFVVWGCIGFSKIQSDMLAILCPVVWNYCENELSKSTDAQSANAASILVSGFLLRCADRFRSSRFHRFDLAINALRHASKLLNSTLERIEGKEDGSTNSESTKKLRRSLISAQLQICELAIMRFNDSTVAAEAFDKANALSAVGYDALWPPVACQHLLCRSLLISRGVISSSRENSRPATSVRVASATSSTRPQTATSSSGSVSVAILSESESLLRTAADISAKWYGRRHSAVADALLALSFTLVQKVAIRGDDRHSRPVSAASDTPHDVQMILDSIIGGDEVERCFREAISILDAAGRASGSDNQRLAQACASLGRFLASRPASSDKREACELLQRATDIELIETGSENAVRPLRSLVKETMLAERPFSVEIVNNQEHSDNEENETVAVKWSRASSSNTSRSVSPQSMRSPLRASTATSVPKAFKNHHRPISSSTSPSIRVRSAALAPTPVMSTSSLASAFQSQRHSASARSNTRADLNSSNNNRNDEDFFKAFRQQQQQIRWASAVFR